MNSFTAYINKKFSSIIFLQIQLLALSIFTAFFMGSCRSGVIEWSPATITDTSNIVITCDASKGNKELFNYKGAVYVHIGLITDASETPTSWHYIKFDWGTEDKEAQAKIIGKNKWSYSIKNIRKFFDVPDDEQILNIAILFRSGACTSDCKVLLTEKGSSFYIPVKDRERPLD